MYFKKNFSKKAKREFAAKMQEIDDFCYKNDISRSSKSDSYYFNLNGKNYRISNHTIEASFKNSSGIHHSKINEQFKFLEFEGRDKNTTYITASKTRIIDIYNDLKNGYELDKRGNRIENKTTNKDEQIDLETLPTEISNSNQTLNNEEQETTSLKM